MKNRSADEPALIRQIVAGDTQRFRILADRYKDVGLSLAYSVLKNQPEAEDALQEAFIKAFRSLGSFKAEAAFSTWFYRIVLNTCYHQLEKRKVRQAESLEERHHQQAGESSAAAPLKQQERQQAINAVLNNLKENEALALRLFYLGEQSIPEIAQITGWSTANVKVVLHRARKSFEQQLHQQFGHEKLQLL